MITSQSFNFNLDKIYSLSKKKELDLVYLLGADEIETKKLEIKTCY